MNESKTQKFQKLRICSYLVPVRGHGVMSFLCEEFLAYAVKKHYVSLSICFYRLRCKFYFSVATSPDVPDSRFDVVAPRPISPGMTARELFKTVIHYLRNDVTELRETAIIGLGHSNPLSFR